MRMRFILLLSLSAYLGNSSAFGLGADQIREQIKAQISARHPDPDSGAFWNQLGPDALPVLKQMLSESTSAYEKSWLIDGLAHFDDPSVGTLLEAQIESGSNEVMKKKMLSALVQSQGDQAYDFVEPYLKDDHEHIRLAVAIALKKYAYEKSKKRLEAFESGEKLAWVKAQYAEVGLGSGEGMKRKGTLYQQESEENAPSLPLPEKAWAGQWSGTYLHGDRSTQGILNLTLFDDKAKLSQKKWKVEIKLPKQTKFDLKEKEFEVVYYQTLKAHWLEIRMKKEDAVFIGTQKQEPKE